MKIEVEQDTFTPAAAAKIANLSLTAFRNRMYRMGIKKPLNMDKINRIINDFVDSRTLPKAEKPVNNR